MPDTVAGAMARQLETWTHLAGDDCAAERAVLMVMAEAVDALRGQVADGGAPLPAINGCRYVLDQLRRERPAEDYPEDGPLSAIAAWVED